MLTGEQQRQYVDDGYFIARGLFNAQEVAELLEATSSLLQQVTLADRSADVGFDPWRKKGGDHINPNRVVYMNEMHLRHPLLDAHMRSARLSSLFNGLWDADINAFQAASVVKPTQHNNDYHGWHQDMPDYVPLSNGRNGCAITYLGHMGWDTGGTSLVPGSHRHGLPERTYHQVPGWPDYLKKRSIEGFDEETADIVSPDFEPGDVLIFHSSLYHRANSNYTDISKVGLINVYQAVDCVDLTSRNKFRAADLPITRGLETVPSIG